MKLFGHSTSTRAALAPRFAAIVLGLMSVLTGSRWLMLLACAAGAVLLVGLLMRPRLDDLALTVTLPARTAVGNDIACTIEVRNTGSGWSPMVHCVHRVAVLDEVTFLVDALPPGARASVEITRGAIARGLARTSTAVLTTTAPLGLRSRSRSIELPLQVIVHPAQVPVVVPPPRAASESAQWTVSRSGTDVHGIREWRPGDDATQVHWRSSARRGRLVVLEREIPKAGGFALVLAAAPGDHDWETVASVGAWTGAAAVRAGRDVTLLAAIPGGAEPGPDDATTILDWCAQASPALPDERQLTGAFAFVGRGGDLTVAAGTSAYAKWWPWASALAARHGIELVALTIPPVSTP